MESGKRGLEAAWKKTLEQIEDEVSEQEFSTWFRGVEYAGGTDSQLQLSVPNSFTKDQITQRYLARIEEKTRRDRGRRGHGQALRPAPQGQGGG